MTTKRHFSLPIASAALALAAAGMVGYGIRAARADGVPTVGALTYSGTLEDVTGKPVNASKMIGVAVYDMQAGGAKVCEAPVALVGVNNGRFDVKLPDDCATATKANANLWIEVTVEGESLGRVKMGAVPYALEAGAASEAKGGLAAALATKADAATVGVVSAWQPYTVKVLTQSSPPTDLTSSAATTEGRWRRVGDSAEVVVVVKFDTKPGGTNYPMTFSLPSGLVVDSAKAIGIFVAPVGVGRYQVDPGGTHVGFVTYGPENSLFLQPEGKSTPLLVGDIGVSTTTYVGLRATVPIAGWSAPAAPP